MIGKISNVSEYSDMALRLGDYIEGGELLNLETNTTHGWLKLRGIAKPLGFELLGNPGKDLVGRHLRFECSASPLKCEERLDARNLQLPDRFIGATGTMTANHQTRLFDCSVEEFLRLCKRGTPPPTFWKRCVYLEWFGNCGRVLLELPDPRAYFVEVLEGKEIPFPLEPLPEPPLDQNDPTGESSPLEILEISTQDDDTLTINKTNISPDEEEDPYALFSDDFKKLIQTQEPVKTNTPDQAINYITSILDSSEEGAPLRSLIGPTPDWTQLDEKQVENHLKQTVALLALHNIAFHMCPHFTYADAARYLFEVLADQELANSQLKGTLWYVHYHTAEHCETCAKTYQTD
ncbi:hypothetical protein VDG1235_3901 [Verrucomicrobiia bacterium DG1235]|nr:hypothetical protein VDG1235_3901 [Verrucomicrobiae bacterium DG1235]